MFSIRGSYNSTQRLTLNRQSKSEMGRDVYVGLSCLGSNSDRKDYDSRKALKKLVDKALSDTNWRLMSDGICIGLDI